MQTAIPAVVMRGGTSKALYFAAADLPQDQALRDRVLLAAMGSPDDRQIDGMGGAHPLTSKVALISPSSTGDTDVDYLFLQVVVGEATVSDSQNCGNILAGVGPYAIERGLVAAIEGQTTVRIRMVNSGGVAVVTVQTPGGQVEYDGNARIDGVPGTAAPVMIDFVDVAGSNCGALLPTGMAVNEVDGVGVTCIDNGMPVVLLRADEFGLSGYEPPGDLEANDGLSTKIESIRRQAGPLMNLGDVAAKTVPKMSLVAPARAGGAICTRTYIPHRVHEAIGVLGAASVAAAIQIPGTVANEIVDRVSPGPMDIEHPTGRFTIDVELTDDGGELAVRRSALLRTARKLMAGEVYIPTAIWSPAC
ncbi:MAG: 4-oxalomesaconate tautomerase [Gammaproteobacteria bacterium]|nr:4-oxalomesaconate tautomerase [Gammaproteobacteria bacterium]